MPDYQHSVLKRIGTTKEESLNRYTAKDGAENAIEIMLGALGFTEKELGAEFGKFGSPCHHTCVRPDGV
jgi:hypothetical protein